MSEGFWHPGHRSFWRPVHLHFLPLPFPPLLLEVGALEVGLRGSAVERQSLESVLSPSCARPVADE